MEQIFTNLNDLSWRLETSKNFMCKYLKLAVTTGFYHDLQAKLLKCFTLLVTLISVLFKIYSNIWRAG